MVPAPIPGSQGKSSLRGGLAVPFTLNIQVEQKCQDSVLAGEGAALFCTAWVLVARGPGTWGSPFLEQGLSFPQGPWPLAASALLPRECCKANESMPRAGKKLRHPDRKARHRPTSTDP